MPPRMRTPKRTKTAGGVTRDRRDISDEVGNDRGCTYQDFVDCGPPEFSGEGGALAYVDWIMKMEMVVDLSECSASRKVEYAAYSLSGQALVWWNEQCTKMGREMVAKMSWDDFKELTKSKFYPDEERQRMEQELLNHKMIGTDHISYTERFRDLTRLVPHMVTPESKEIELYIRGLNPQLQEMAATTYPLTIQDVMAKVDWLADEVMRQISPKRNARAERESDKLRNSSNGGRKTKVREAYAGSYSWCQMCDLHHPTTIPCATCYQCNRLGHLAKDCQGETGPEAPVRVEDPTVNKRACYECGSQSHLQNACPRRHGAPNQGRENNHIWGWTHVTNVDGTRQEIPILARDDEYADVGATV